MKCVVLVQFIILILLAGCAEQETQESRASCFFKGNHELVSLNCYAKSLKNEMSETKFFLVLDSYKNEVSGSIVEVAKFVWKDNNGVNVISELPIHKVRFVTDSTIEKPFCKFRWQRKYDFSEINWSETVVYVVLYLREENISSDGIRLNLNSPEKILN